MRLGVRVKADAVRTQALQIPNRRHHALAAEPVQRPEQDAIELAFGSIIEQRGELLALVGTLATALVVNVFMNDLMASVGAPRP